MNTKWQSLYIIFFFLVLPINMSCVEKKLFTPDLKWEIKLELTKKSRIEVGLARSLIGGKGKWLKCNYYGRITKQIKGKTIMLILHDPPPDNPPTTGPCRRAPIIKGKIFLSITKGNWLIKSKHVGALSYAKILSDKEKGE